MDMDKEKALLSKEVALQRDIIYLDEDLTPAQISDCKGNMHKYLNRFRNEIHRDLVLPTRAVCV